MKVGDYVKYGAPNGSTGRIESANHYGGFYVVWVYGRDRVGDVMSATSSVREEMLMPATEAEYIAMRDRQGFAS